LLKDKRFLKFFIIGERRRTTAGGGESMRTAVNARERLFAVRILRLRLAKIVIQDNKILIFFLNTKIKLQTHFY
jgi:hypothetical protein